MQAWHERNLLAQAFPFRLFISENLQFPPHWHEEIEVVYVLDGALQIGINNELHSLGSKDILLIGSGDVHYFMPQNQKSKTAIIQFGISIFDTFSTTLNDRKFTRLLLGNSKRLSNNWDAKVHKDLEQQIILLLEEYEKKQEGYQMALKARLYDLVVILLRGVRAERYSPREKNKQMNRLERLEKVFEHVEGAFDQDITLSEISKIANFSVYHFTRFFKETTGMTFGQYLSNYRVKKAEWYLVNTNGPITQIAFKSGFNSTKTFNRVFKELKGCSPSEYKKAISER